MQKFLSLLFTISAVLSFFMLFAKLLRHLLIDKTIGGLFLLSNEQRQKTIGFYRKLPTYNRAGLWILLFSFIVFFAVLALSFINPDFAVAIYPTMKLVGIIDVLVLIHIIDEFYYTKRILKAIDKSFGRETL
ncbi:MAG: hypothetical protein HY867_19460 [Chloroflexi bacterium]|nr:hypothetical protein [Chloroflexota bacterium]